MPDERRQIIAIGGGGTVVDLDNVLERYVLAQARVSDPAICFVPTASGDADASVVRFYTTFSSLPCRPSHLSFFRRTPADLRSHVLRHDIVYVGGGNTRSMLAVWKEWGLPQILHEAWEAGIVLAGGSAGAICWFEQGVTDSVADQLLPLDCLGFLPGSCCPHYDGEAERRPAYHRLLLSGSICAGIAIDDRVAVHFRGSEVHRIVTARERASAYRVRVMDGVVQEEAMPVDLIKITATGGVLSVAVSGQNP